MASTSASDRHVILYGVPWEVYKKIVEALGEYHFRHVYVEGTLEAPALLNGVSWADYKKFLEALGDYSVRHTYDGWHLEMMSPRKDHDWAKKLIGRMVEAMALDLNIPIQSIGSTTLSSDDVERGVEPDEAYYVANESVVRGKNTYDPDIDPPPDLLIEVDVTNSSVPRMPTMASLSIPEIWRSHDGTLTFYARTEASYQEIPVSVAFPFLTPNPITQVLSQFGSTDENSLVRMFVDSAREAYERSNQ